MKGINFDQLACSPVLKEAREAMMPFLSEETGNPLSGHIFGEKPREAVEEARENVANLVGAEGEEILFTSCGSESNNWAVHGIVKAHSKKGKHLIASPVEHHSILHPLRSLEKEGYELSWLRVDDKGLVDPDEISSLIRKDTVLITVTSASNEIGTLEPIEEIGTISREKGVIFHTDAAASAGSVPIHVRDLNVDLLTLAGNTFYGPPGTGALYVRKGVRISPLISGGIQERGLRAGTHNVACIVGMGAAAKAARERLPERQAYITRLRDRLIRGVLENVPESFLTGHPVQRLPGHASFCIRFIEGESILMHLNSLGIAGSSGSTCSSQALKVSHVLEAIGVEPVQAQGSVTFSLGIENTPAEVDVFLKELPAIAEELRKISPLVAKHRARQGA